MQVEGRESEFDADGDDAIAVMARAYRRVLKLARTMVNLAGKEAIRSAHLAEASLVHRFTRKR